MIDEYEKTGADRAVDLLAQNKQLQAELEKHRWIPISELPALCSPFPVSKDILLICNDELFKGYYCENEGWVIYSSYEAASKYQDQITYWKPIILPDQALKDKRTFETS